MEALDRLQFLVGEWTSPVTGEELVGTSGESKFSYQLDRKIMVRNSFVKFAPGPGEEKGFIHEDLLVIYQQPGEDGFHAIYFDNEGHTLNYVVDFLKDQSSVVFETSAQGPQARLVYTSMSDGRMMVEFFVAAPGGELLSHVKGVLERKI